MAAWYFLRGFDYEFYQGNLKKNVKNLFQTAVSYAAIHITTVDFTESKQLLRAALTGIGVSAAAAGLSAAMNLEKSKLMKAVQNNVLFRS